MKNKKNLSKKIFLLIMIGFFILPTMALAFVTGNDLVARCVSKKNPEYIACVSYVQGHLELAVGLQGEDLYTLDPKTTGTFKKQPKACVPENVSVGQFTKLFLKFTDKKPEALHKSAAVILYATGLFYFPCQEGY